MMKLNVLALAVILSFQASAAVTLKPGDNFEAAMADVMNGVSENNRDRIIATAQNRLGLNLEEAGRLADSLLNGETFDSPEDVNKVVNPGGTNPGTNPGGSGESDDTVSKAEFTEDQQRQDDALAAEAKDRADADAALNERVDSKLDSDQYYIDQNEQDQRDEAQDVKIDGKVDQADFEADQARQDEALADETT
ncbi:hypothetical protein ABRV10_003459, partial [Citrobacter amalonaticus]